MNTYIVHFVVDTYAFNDRFLTTSRGERRLQYRITAKTAEEAYLEGVKKAREQTALTFELVFCKRFDKENFPFLKEEQ